MVNPVVVPSLIYAVICISLTACGFKLAGTTSLPQSLSSIFLITTDFSESQRDALVARLAQAGAMVKTQADGTAVLLTVRLRSIPGRTLVTSASTGKTVDRLARKLEYSLKSADGKLLAGPRTLIQQKEIVLDDNNLHASSREKVDVIKDLEKALFNQLIHQLKRG